MVRAELLRKFKNSSFAATGNGRLKLDNKACCKQCRITSLTMNEQYLLNIKTIQCLSYIQSRQKKCKIKPTETETQPAEMAMANTTHVQ